MPHFFSIPDKFPFVKVFLLRHIIFLERSLTHAGDLALVGELAEADTANAVVAEVGMGSAADLAAVVAAGGELVSSLLLQDHCFSSHCVLPPN